MTPHPRPPKKPGSARSAESPVRPLAPPTIAFHAVPGTSELTATVHGPMGAVATSIRQARDHHPPGTIACWVTCLVCEARLCFERTPDGRPIFDGGILEPTVINPASRKPQTVAVACRCSAGQNWTTLRPATDTEYRRAIARRKVRLLRGLRAISDAVFIEFVLQPRGSVFCDNWQLLAERYMAEGADVRRAWHRAYVTQLWRWQRE